MLRGEVFHDNLHLNSKKILEGFNLTNPAAIFIYISISKISFEVLQFLHNWKLFIDSFSLLVELLFLCDVTGTISHKI